MKKQLFFFLLMIFPLSSNVQAQYTLESDPYLVQRWKTIEKESWKYNKAYTYSYFTPDSTVGTSISYDTLNGVERIETYYGNGDSLIGWVFDSNISVFKYEQNGPTITFYENQKVKSIQCYFLGIPIGKWISYFPNGEIERIENYPNDTSIYSLCENYIIATSSPEGRGIRIGSAGNTKGVPHGEWLEFYSNGNPKAKKNFHIGLEIGRWEWYYENGIKKMEGSYFEGYLEKHPCEITVIDDELIFDNDEEIYSAAYFYVHIRPKHGIWKYYDEKGNLVKEEIYDQGKLIQPKKNTKSKKQK